GGRPVAADNTAWALYWVLQSAVLLRVIAALWPAVTTALTLFAVFAWATATVGWAIRYGRWFGRPRLDGRPG
ncbi:MAG: NnrS family protein, partial [Burkholderiales bacterium]|nr:NnrS family protein [Burkholderiales bacterium]